jgi:hypothetical protein
VRRESENRLDVSQRVCGQRPQIKQYWLSRNCVYCLLFPFLCSTVAYTSSIAYSDPMYVVVVWTNKELSRPVAQVALLEEAAHVHRTDTPSHTPGCKAYTCTAAAVLAVLRPSVKAHRRLCWGCVMVQDEDTAHTAVVSCGCMLVREIDANIPLFPGRFADTQGPRDTLGRFLNTISPTLPYICIAVRRVDTALSQFRFFFGFWFSFFSRLY